MSDDDEALPPPPPPEEEVKPVEEKKEEKKSPRKTAEVMRTPIVPPPPHPYYHQGYYPPPYPPPYYPGDSPMYYSMFPTPPYGYPPPFMPRSPYYQDPNAMRPYCPVTPSPGRYPYEEPSRNPYVYDDFKRSRDDSRFDELRSRKKPKVEPSEHQPSMEAVKGLQERSEEHGDTPISRVFVKSKVPISNKARDWRERKNMLSRERSAKTRELVEAIRRKPESERTEKEKEMLERNEDQRNKKNQRSRDRALEKNAEVNRILAKPEKERSQIEWDFLKTVMTAKKIKNQNDRDRRRKVKMAKLGKQSVKVSREDQERLSVLQSFEERQQHQMWTAQQEAALQAMQGPWNT